MKKIILVFGLILTLLLTACEEPPADSAADMGHTETIAEPTESSGNKVTMESIDTSGLFSDRDFKTGYDETSCAYITLEGDAAKSTSNAVVIDGSTITITDEGTYILSGMLEDGMIEVNAGKEDKVQLVLNGVSVHSQTSAALYILQADKVFVTTAAGTENTLSNGGEFIAIDTNNIDAAVFSKEDITLNGSGVLRVISPGGHGIVSKDELTITGGSYDISCSSHGLSGKDSVCIAGAQITVASGKDGIHAENDEDANMGFIYIQSGSFSITAEGDGISAGSCLQIDDGTFDLLCGGGYINGEQHTSDGWGGMPGGMGGGMGGGMPGGMPGGMGGGKSDSGSDLPASTEDSTSIKGIKAGGNIWIYGGSFAIDSADDAIHSNASLFVAGGVFDLTSGDDGFHADATLSVSDGAVDITQSYEALEGLAVDISGGKFNLFAADDGINAAGGADQSGFGGLRGDQFASNSSSDSYISISGGDIYINAGGDGVDSNGSLIITGGSVVVSGGVTGDTAVLDYETTGTITGGSFIGTGATMMAQTFSSAQQGVFAVQSSGSYFEAGTTIALTGSDGEEVISYTPDQSFALIIFSNEHIVSGETYTIWLNGTEAGAFEAY